MKLAAWSLKRLMFNRLATINAGQVPAPTGSELLVSTVARPVEVAHFLPPEPDRVCVYGMPVRASFDEITAESPDQLRETPTVEVRVRLFEAGEDVAALDAALGEMCTAVVNAVLGYPLLGDGRLWLAAMAQDIPELQGLGEPSVTLTASLAFRAEVVARG